MNENQTRDDELAKIRSEATNWLAKQAQAQQKRRTVPETPASATPASSKG